MAIEYLFLFSPLLGIISFISISLLLRNIYKHNPKPTEISPPPPPGKTGWPLVGETLEYLSYLRNGALDKFVSDRSNRYASKVFTTSLFGYPMAILCGAEGNKFLFSNENKLVRIWLPSSVQKIFPKSHDTTIHEDIIKLQKMVGAFFKENAVQTLVGQIDSTMKQHVKTFHDCEQINVRNVAGKYTLAVACRLFLGMDEPEKLEPVKEIAAGILSMGINFPGTAFHRALKAYKALCAEIVEIIKQKKMDHLEKKALPTQDILSHMLLATDENGTFLNEADITSNLVGLLHAGFDPIRAALTFVMKYMAELPHVYNEVLREQMEIAKSKKEKDQVLLNWEDTRKMRYSWNVACEVMRLMPPVLGTFREAITDFTYDRYLIPKGMKIHWISHSTHKDPKHFKNPEKFDPSRFEGNGPPPFAFVPFGGGPCMCPGNEYTKLVILVFMHNIVTNFKWELLIANEKVTFDPHPRPAHGLPVCLYPHKP
ncbi:Dammarenediol 12-hydroxylase [Actinidia chinensis var. chinensis]|uniref:Dammarenediol 12-hydroxylase n=1 Tax=Actinidia chinensis var. chinensis TaxID=1590841 RepID=A0A2R6PUZ5_ACTCC|nr:Dammarenediol 12-hydroxylase [Actinidia chinensis var. chinensis]